ncbi:hypothetical protein PAEPH01_2053 [Pancytospora epiphaga]|nr:hypothetical protein PAEPH01_2053 [Pancytospora epiphaga]
MNPKNEDKSQDNNNNRIVKIEEKEQRAIIDKGSDINVMDNEVAQTNDLEVKETEKVEPHNVFGKIKEVNKKTTVNLKDNKVKVIADFVVRDTADKETVLIGDPTIRELESKSKELNEL